MQLFVILLSAAAAHGFAATPRLSALPRHCRSALVTAPQMKEEGTPKEGPKYRFGSITESVVRGVTGNEDYKFGDGTKAVVGKAAAAAEAAASGLADAAVVTDTAAKEAADTAAKVAAEAADAAAKNALEVAKASAEVAATAADVAAATDEIAKAAAAEAAKAAVSASIGAGAAAKDALDERYDGCTRHASAPPYS